ncbi:MAG: hypothetical protein Q8P18_29290 [Pseudomonadota bacterium]|nr:hypothetical protein [Pseudomonadota bacterium]
MSARRIALLLLLPLAACTDKDEETGDTSPTTDSWSLLAEDQPAALLSVGGTAADDVWVVGADAGSGPTVLHYDGSAWTPVDTATQGDLWWVAAEGPSSAETVWMSGAGGRVLELSRATGVTVEHVLDPAITVFGVWAAAEGDVWAVGGNIESADASGQVWHWDGAAWALATIPAEASGALALYKVWGRSPTDVYAVGTGGVGLHWDGAAWASFATGTTRNLFTVHGTDVAVWAVGGFASGTVVTSTGGAWADETPALAPQLNGVSASGPVPVAVGIQGAVYARGADGWAPDPAGPFTAYDLHAVWSDPDGGTWTVGGKLASFPLDHGVLAYSGDADPPSL